MSSLDFEQALRSIEHIDLAAGDEVTGPAFLAGRI